METKTSQMAYNLDSLFVEKKSAHFSTHHNPIVEVLAIATNKCFTNNKTRNSFGASI